MGFFDNLLKDIANGELDKKLETVADKLENVSEKFASTSEKLADLPTKALDNVQAKKESLEEKAALVTKHAKHTVEVATTEE